MRERRTIKFDLGWLGRRVMEVQNEQPSRSGINIGLRKNEFNNNKLRKYSSMRGDLKLCQFFSVGDSYSAFLVCGTFAFFVSHICVLHPRSF